jgi:hypothetical protein
MPLTPRPVAPGWASRWRQQSADLWRRSPMTIISSTGALTAFTVVVPEFVLLDILVAITGTAAFFCLVRALDHNPLRPWTATLQLLRSVLTPTLLLARDVFLIYFLFFFALLAMHTLLDTAVASAHILLPKPHASTAYRALPGWMRSGIRREESLIYLSFFTPVIAPLIYLTLIAGHQIVVNFQVAFRAVVLNVRPSFAVMVAAWLGSAVLHATLRLFPEYWFGLLLLPIFGLVYCALGTITYLWCREMFEGIAENAAHLAGNPSSARAVAVS